MNTLTGHLVVAAVKMVPGGLGLVLAKLTGTLQAAWFGILPWVLTVWGAAAMLFFLPRGMAAAGSELLTSPRRTSLKLEIS